MISIEVRQGLAGFRPGERVEGTVRWMLDAPPVSVELRLFWYTRGTGEQDVEVVSRQLFEGAGIQDVRPFSFELPASPFSYSGKLISLVWALEAVAKPSNETARVDLVVSPTCQGKPAS